MSMSKTLDHKFALATIFQALIELGLEGARVPFNGENDSGQLDDPEPMTNAWTTETYNIFNNHTFPNHPNLPSLPKLIRQAAEHIQETHGDNWPDWYNNDGGRGTIDFIVNGEGDDGQHYTNGICVCVYTYERTETPYHGVYSEGGVAQ